jgi:hypothetical protein
LRARCGELIRCGDPKPWLIREWGETKNQCPPTKAIGKFYTKNDSTPDTNTQPTR